MINGMVRYGSFWYPAHNSDSGSFLPSSSVFAANGGAAIAAVILAPVSLGF